MKNQNAKYSIQMADVADDAACPTCDATMAESCGLRVMLGDSPVCDACAKQHAPMLASLVALTDTIFFDFAQRYERALAA